MKILMLNAGYAPFRAAGAAHSVRLLAEALVQLRHRVCVVSQTPHFGNDFTELAGVEVAYVGSEASGDEAAEFLASTLVEFPADVVHTHHLGHFPRREVTEILAASPAAWIHSLREYSLLCRNGTLWQEQGACPAACPACDDLTQPAQRFAAAVDGVIGISRYILNRHLAAGLFDDTEQAVIHNISPLPSESELVMQCSLPSLPLRLGYLGRLASEKGIQLLIETLRQHVPPDNYRLLIAGGGDPAYESHLRAKAKGAPINWRGYSSPADFLPQIDLLVVPSLWEEPLGRVVHEAYAWGVPVICTRRGGMPEIVEDGVTGLLYQPLGQPSLGDVLRPLFESPKEIAAMQLAAHQAAEKFAAEKIVAEHLAFYRRLAASVRSRE